MCSVSPTKGGSHDPLTATMILGEVASSGVAQGTAVVRSYAENTAIARHVIEESEVSQEIERLDAAIAKAEKGMLKLRDRIERHHGDHEAAIFDAHIALLHDSSLRKTIIALCTTSKLNVEAAVSEAIDTLVAAFARLNNPYFRERAADLRDVGDRLLDALTKDEQHESFSFPEGTVLVAGELLPSMIAQLDEKAIRAVRANPSMTTSALVR